MLKAESFLIFDNRILTGIKYTQVARIHFVFRVDFMVKLLRACVWMPRRQQAKKDVASYDKLREAAHRQ